MKSVNIRDFGEQRAEIQKQLQQRSELLLMSEGKPIAIMLPTDEDSYESLQKAVRQARSSYCLEMLRRQAAEQGLDKMTMEEINAEIKAYRKERREALLEGRG